jgi:hypothetical protein
MKSDTHFDLTTSCPSVRFPEEGIYYNRERVGEISYPVKGNEACFEVEDQSFWFRHRNDCIRELVRSFPPRGGGPIYES